MIEKQILAALIYNENYLRQALPFLKDEYFSKREDRSVFNLISSYIRQYNTRPSTTALTIDASTLSLSQEELDRVVETIQSLKEDHNDQEWLVDQTEKFCQDRAIYNAIMSSIQILDGRDTKHGKGNIPQILIDALAVSFDTHIGHDFLEDYSDRYDFYHKKEDRLPFDLEYFNRITKGGLPKKTLNVALAGTGVGKSLFMCHCAASNLLQGRNVLYVTLEMSEEKIAERIDANLLNVQVDELTVLPKEAYEKKIQRV